MARHVTLYVAHTEHCQQVLFLHTINPPHAVASGNYRCPWVLKSVRIMPCSGVRLIAENFNMETLNQYNRSFKVVWAIYYPT